MSHLSAESKYWVAHATFEVVSRSSVKSKYRAMAQAIFELIRIPYLFR